MNQLEKNEYLLWLVFLTPNWTSGGFMVIYVGQIRGAAVNTFRYANDVEAYRLKEDRHARDYEGSIPSLW